MQGWLGWDVGAWHCQSGASRDALVLLAADLGQAPRLVGRAWRGNLRTTLNGPRGPGLLAALLRLVGAADLPLRRLTIGVDTPLGWPDAFRALLGGELPAQIPSTKAENPLIMRQTERVLCAAGLRPLSPVQDLLGSQSTKGLVALGALGMAPRTPGWWTGALGGVELAAFEAYPTPCRRSARVEARVGPRVGRRSGEQAPEVQGEGAGAGAGLADGGGVGEEGPQRVGPAAEGRCRRRQREGPAQGRHQVAGPQGGVVGEAGGVDRGQRRGAGGGATRHRAALRPRGQ
jgi:hypothetical protein